MLLATDLDGTFLAGDPEDRLSLYQTIAAHPEIKLAYVTGRSLEAVLPLLADPTLPQPDYIIADVGATLVHGDSLQPIQQLLKLVLADPSAVLILRGLIPALARVFGQLAQIALQGIAHFLHQFVDLLRRCAFADGFVHQIALHINGE